MTLYFKPNPCSVAPEVLAAQASPPEAFESGFEAGIKKRLTNLFFREAEQLTFFTCTREGLYQMALNCFGGNHNLFLVNGPMAQEWYEIAREAGMNADIFDIASGGSVNLKLLAQQLSLKKYDAVMFVETDIYTGTHLDGSTLCSLIRSKQPEALLIADCSASISCSELLSLDNKVNVYICASEMALGLPPGLGIVAAGSRAHTKALGKTSSQWYFDYAKANINLKDNKLYSVLPYQLLNALDKQLDRIVLEGLDERMARTQRMSQLMRDWAEKHGFQVMGTTELQAPNVTVLFLPPQFTPNDISEYLKQFGIYISTGYGEAKANTIVISHTNNITESDMNVLFEVTEKFLADYDTRNNRFHMELLHRRRR